MADVFVSYSREDKARAAQVVSLLDGDGWDVFWDQETRAGTMWPKVLEQELDTARCLIALWTTTSIDSRWVRIEAYEALQADKLLPLLLDDVRPPLEFRQTQTFDLVGWNGDRTDPRVTHLLADLRALMHAPQDAQRPANIAVNTISRPRPLPEAQRRETDSDGKRQGRTLLQTSGIAVGVVAAGIAAAWVLWLDGEVPADRSSAKEERATVAPEGKQPPPLVVERASEPAPAPISAPINTVERPPPHKPPVATAGKVAPPPIRAGRAPRCSAIEERFQETGQISSADRDFLLSKECQR